MAGKNRYLIEVTLIRNFSIEADSEAEAVELIDDALHDEGLDSASYAIEKTKVVEVELDASAKDAARVAACDVFWDARDRYGLDHPATIAAYAKLREIDNG